jgi:hypothetical protein
MLLGGVDGLDAIEVSGSGDDLAPLCLFMARLGMSLPSFA